MDDGGRREDEGFELGWGQLRGADGTGMDGRTG